MMAWNGVSNQMKGVQLGGVMVPKNDTKNSLEPALTSPGFVLVAPTLPWPLSLDQK